MEIFHRKQLIMNPLGSDKLNRFCVKLDLKENSKVIDIGCGKGEFLLRLYNLYKITGVGIDKSSYCIHEAKQQKQLRTQKLILSIS